jgi:hypothetical protein
MAAGSAVLLGLLSAGCGGDDERRPLPRPAREVAAVVRTLERGLAEGDYGRICRDVFSKQVRRQAGGRGCPAMLRRTAAGVKRPSILIRRIEVRGARASAEVRTRARGEAPSTETIELVREAGAFRIVSLSR